MIFRFFRNPAATDVEKENAQKKKSVSTEKKASDVLNKGSHLSRFIPLELKE